MLIIIFTVVIIYYCILASLIVLMDYLGKYEKFVKIWNCTILTIRQRCYQYTKGIVKRLGTLTS